MAPLLWVLSRYLQVGISTSCQIIAFAKGVQWARSGSRPCMSPIGRAVACRTMASAAAAAAASKANRLAAEKSPYLLQHKHNPVEWYPWGQEAFEKAQRDGKPIFLSVGYSTCHWCHVMERESFEDPRVGKLMSDLFVNIKVDREERPDVDKVYMTFIQAISGGGGWPMSVFLTPDLKPITGGTYFPPETDAPAALGGRRTFPSVLRLIDGQWRSKRAEVQSQGEMLATALKKATEGETPLEQVPLADAVTHKCYGYFNREFDARFGGFGGAPKFPQPSNLVFLLDVASRSVNAAGVRADRATDMIDTTLTRMANGGIYDHVAQGMHRYSTDERWHVPHFEKMLYDQAQLTKVYALAYTLTKNPLYEKVTRGIIEYVDRDLSHRLGGCFSAEDADSLPAAGGGHKREGAFCVWTWDELRRLLAGEPAGRSQKTVADVFVHYYNCKRTGNTNPVMDPHGELLDQNVLIAYEPLDKTAEELEMDEADARAAIDRAHHILYEERRRRPKPHLDTKMLTAWNGLMISGYAHAAIALGDQKIADRAVKCAQFVLENLTVDGDDKSELLRSCYCPQRGDPTVEQLTNPIRGFSDDYAYFISSLLDLYAATLNDKYVRWAEQLQAHMDRLLWDERYGGYFLSRAGDPSILFRMKDDQDGAEPSANGVAAHNLDRLAALTGDAGCSGRAGRIYRAFGRRLTHVPHALPYMAAALAARSPMKLVVITGLADDEAARKLVTAVQFPYLPGVVLARASDTDCLTVSRQSCVRDAVHSDLAAGVAAAHVFAATFDRDEREDSVDGQNCFALFYQKRFDRDEALRKHLEQQ